MPYDPFAPGPYPVEVRTTEAHDTARDRRFPVEIWHPGQPGPLIVYSHASGLHRRAATFLTRHLASHGYLVAALDHSEVVAPELRRPDAETPEHRARRIEEVVGSRVPDIQFLVGFLGDADRVGLVGHSFGGWAVLATPEVDARVASVVALAPGGGEPGRPGLLPLTLDFRWGREVPALYLVGDADVPTPPEDVCRLFDRTPSAKRIFVLRDADHQHFLDDVGAVHEAARAMEFPPEARWITESMRPISELCTEADAHAFTRGLTLAHFDATLRGDEAAERFLAADAPAALAARGIELVDGCGSALADRVIEDA